jgi:hypothetical protein
MGRDTDPRRTGTERTDEPRNWDRGQMEPDRGDEGPMPRDDQDADVPVWNEGQMTGERADGTRSRGPTDEEIAASRGGLSGGGANPGGGERWAERNTKGGTDRS